MSILVDDSNKTACRAADAGLREKDAVLKERLAEVAALLVRDEKKSFSREATK